MWEASEKGLFDRELLDVATALIADEEGTVENRCEKPILFLIILMMLRI